MADRQAALDLTVHHYQRVPGTLEVRLTRTNPYVRLSVGTDPPVFIQAGRYWAAGGPEIPASQLPPWFWEEAAKVSPERRLEVGLVLPANQPETPAPLPPPLKPAAKQWTCPECDRTMKLTAKSFHVLRHRRQRPVEAAGSV